jgi:hypothetical protein
VDGRTDGLRHVCQKNCRDGWKKVFYLGEPTVAEKKSRRGPHAPASEIHLLALVEHAPVCRWLLETQVVEEQAEDDGEGGGLARVIQEVAEDNRSRFENFKPKS